MKHLPLLVFCLIVLSMALLTEVRSEQQHAAPAAVDLAGTKAGEERSDNALKMKFVWCPPGEFSMGEKTGPFSRAVHPVTVTLTKGFWLGQFEVTQGEYQQTMETNPSYFSPEGTGKEEVEGADTSRLPVEQVSWKDSIEFCRRLTDRERRAGRLPSSWEFTLPTEAQWEYACRAGTSTKYSFGDRLTASDANIVGVKDLINIAPDGVEFNPVPKAVGSYRPNPWGLYDMHGNVSEWCRDWYARQLPGGADPEVTKEIQTRIIRGGGLECNFYQCHTTYRYTGLPEHGYRYYGFRVALVSSR